MMNFEEAEKLASRLVDSRSIDEVAEAIFWMISMSEYCRQSLRVAKNRIDKNEVYRAADAIEIAIRAKDSALAEHEKVWDLVGERLGESDLLWEAFCGVESLAVEIYAIESERQKRLNLGRTA